MENKISPELANQGQSFSFVNVKPGGNNTCLVDGVIDDKNERRIINDEIMSLYPDVEQVGFVDSDTSTLCMAGGEFCGNATRSAAFFMLNGNPGEVNIQVSGVENRLKAGINSNGEAYAEMPIYFEGDRVQQDKDNPQANTVYMQGITQYVIWDDPNVANMLPEQIKQYALGLLKKKGYDTGYAASGVMFVSQTEKGIEIIPVVYVRDIDTLFYETACGSGTTAVGMVIAKEEKKGVSNLPVIQPSGLPIRVTVDYDSEYNEFSYAQISGPINTLNTGVLVETPKGAYVIERIQSTDQLNKAFTTQRLVDAYGVFSDPPYNEQFTTEEIRDIFSTYVKKGLLFISRTSENIIGFGAAVPLREEPSILELAQQFGVDPDTCWYMADLGVVKERRGEKIATSLVLARLNAFPKGSTAIMRTSINNDASQALYKKLGFKQIEGMTQDITQQRTDGTKKTDKRVFFTKVI